MPPASIHDISKDNNGSFAFFNADIVNLESLFEQAE